MGYEERHKAIDANGVELKYGDYVQLQIDHPFNRKLKRGAVLRVNNWSYRMGGVVIWLASKPMRIVYDSGLDGKHLKKVNWCERKKRVIE